MATTIINGDALAELRKLPAESVHCCVTSPPYWGLRDYGVDGQLGLERTPEEYVAKMVEVFAEVRRVLRKDGTCWVNLGDSYNSYAGNRGESIGKANRKHHDIMPAIAPRNGLSAKGVKNKDLIGIPWAVAFALRSDGWYLRQDIIWHKPNPMPESVRDRCTKAHEYIFLLSKSERYHFDQEAIAEPFSAPPKTPGGFAPEKAVGPMARSNGHSQWEKRRTLEASYPNETRNRRSVWTVATSPYPGAHFATFPPELIKPCILAGCPEGGTVLDPFAGSGTTLEVADACHCDAIGIELNPDYIKLIKRRLQQPRLGFAS